MDLAKAVALENEAKKTDGKCSHCGNIIKIYRYGISKSMVAVLKAMAAGTPRDTTRAVDVDKLNLKHSQRTQLTKMRFHALVAKVKDDDKHQIPRHWLITRKGWQFLGGAEVAAKVLVYNNQGLGHDGGVTTIKRVSGEPGDFEAKPITEPEARAYHNVREPKKMQKILCEYTGIDYAGRLKGDEVELTIERIQFGKPVKIVAPFEQSYNDIASFAKDWRIKK